MNDVPPSLMATWADAIRASNPSVPLGHKLKLESVGGGSINQACKIRINQQAEYFCKMNDRSRFPGLFQSERNGLELLDKFGTIRTPRIISSGEHGDLQFLILEWIEPGNKNVKFWRLFGEQLDRQHLVLNEYFGLNEDNYMGALMQKNHLHKDWISFYISERLEPQIKLAMDNRFLDKSHARRFEILYNSFETIFSEERPSLLHGDLWSGNFICDQNDQPVLIDPAVYFGHRMIDIAMTRLFGGFDKEFYDAYRHQYPITGDEEAQTKICQLYPLLIHLNLFGRSYLCDILQIIDRWS